MVEAPLLARHTDTVYVIDYGTVLSVFKNDIDLCYNILFCFSAVAPRLNVLLAMTDSSYRSRMVDNLSHVCITCLYHVYVSRVCITCMYHMYVSRVCITCMYHMSVSRVCITCLYHVYVSRVCITCLYHVYVSHVCITCMYHIRIRIILFRKHIMLVI